MALACGVRIFVTAVLKSAIISYVICFLSTPFACASDFCRLPRWSIAAAAIMPFSLASAFMCFSLPSDNVTINALSLAVYRTALLERALLSSGSSVFITFAATRRLPSAVG